MWRALRAIPEPAPWRKMCCRRVTGKGAGGAPALGDAEEVGQDVSGADAGELIGVPDEEQVGPLGHGLDQLVGQQGVQHARLVHHHQVGGEGILAVAPGLAPGTQLQETVEGRGGEGGGFFHPFRRAPGGGGEDAAQPFGPGQGEDALEGVRLPCPRPPGEEGDGGGEGGAHGRLLLRGQAQVVALGQPAEGDAPVHGGEDAGGRRPAFPARRAGPPGFASQAPPLAPRPGLAGVRPGRPRRGRRGPGRSGARAPGPAAGRYRRMRGTGRGWGRRSRRRNPGGRPRPPAGRPGPPPGGRRTGPPAPARGAGCSPRLRPPPGRAGRRPGGARGRPGRCRWRGRSCPPS